METNRHWETRPELNSLIAYCNDVIRPKLAALETQRLAMRQRRYIRTPIYLALFITAVLVIAKVTGRNGFVLQLLFVGCGMFIMSLLSGFYKTGKLAKSEIIADMFTHLGWNYTAEFEKSTDFYHLDRHGVFPKWDKKRYEDKIIGEIANIPFTAHEIHLEHGSGDSEVKHDLFMIKVPLEQNFSGLTLVRAKRASLDFNQRTAKNLTRIKFVSSQFEKLFNVFSTDGVEAQYLLPPDHVEDITAFKQDLEGKRPDELQVALGEIAEEISQAFMSSIHDRKKTTLESMTFLEGHLFIVLGSSDFFEIKRTRLSLEDPIHVDVILAEIDFIFQVFDRFKKRMKETI